MNRSIKMLKKTFTAAMEGRNPGTYRATHDDCDEDMDWYVYRLRNGVRVVVATELYEDDARFIAACYNHVGKVLELLEEGSRIEREPDHEVD